jgi:hypothetical protein
MALAHLGRAVYKSAAMGGLAAEGRAWRLRRHACLRRLPPPAPGTRTGPIIGHVGGLGGAAAPPAAR